MAAQAYLARALAANGAVHLSMARRASPEVRVPEYRMAADLDRQAVDEWRLYPNRMKEPYLGEISQTESELAEAERELQKAAN